MKMIWYSGRVYDIEKQTVPIKEEDAEYLKSVYRQFEKPDAAAALEVFRKYCNVGDPMAHVDPVRSHAQKHREISYLRLENDIWLGKHLSGKEPRNVTILKEDDDERRADYNDTGSPADFTPGG